MNPELYFPALATIIALVVYYTQAAYVGMARSKYGIKAPATTGNTDFERIFRVHYSTLEQLPIFITLLWFFALTVSPYWAGALGLVWSVGRIGYMYGYYKGADKRHSYGSALSYLTNIIFLIGSLWIIIPGLF
jgi:glutathione S-transferase